MADNNLGNKKPAGSRSVRLFVGIVAALVIAFCGWSAFEYTQGQNPLGFIQGSAFQTVKKTTPGKTSTKIKLESTTISDKDVVNQIARLSWNKKDVSLPADDVNVVLAKNGIWVENGSKDKAPDAVAKTTQRLASLAQWAKKKNIETDSIVWITEDEVGSVRMAATLPLTAVKANMSESDILSACSGYAISGDAYAALGKDPGFKQAAGKAPVLPNGTAVTVVDKPTSEGEVLTESKQTYSVLAGSSDAVADRGKASEKKGGSPAGKQNSQNSSGITVSISVDASIVGAGSSSATVSLKRGASVYDALRATGVSMNAYNTQYGIYVASIGGLAEKEHGSTSGWMYSVNGTVPMKSCANYRLSDGDVIRWYYVTSDD